MECVWIANPKEKKRIIRKEMKAAIFVGFAPP